MSYTRDPDAFRDAVICDGMPDLPWRHGAGLTAQSPTRPSVEWARLRARASLLAARYAELVPGAPAIPVRTTGNGREDPTSLRALIVELEELIGHALGRGAGARL